jgi:hypothetical protein
MINGSNAISIHRRAERFVKESGARCTCHWLTGNHADSCDLAQAWDRAVAWAEDEEYDARWNTDNQ